MWVAGRTPGVNSLDAVKVNRYDAAAIQMVMAWMDALFLVDRDARKKEMTAEERLISTRRQHGEVWGRRDSARMHQAVGHCVTRKSATGKAVSYTLNMWPKLRRCSDLRGSGTVQQPGRKFDATGGAGP